MKLLKIDEQGFFIEDIITDKRPTIPEVKVDDEGKEYMVDVPDPQFIAVSCPPGFYRPKWDGSQWTEGMPQADIDEIKSVPVPPTTEEKVQQLQEENINLMLASAETYETMYQENVNLMLAVTELYEIIMNGGV